MINWRSKNNEVSGGVWKAVETKARKTKVVKIKRRIEKGKNGKEMEKERAEKEGRKEKEEKAKKRENNRSKESGRRMGNLGQKRKSSKVRRKSTKVDTRMIEEQLRKKYIRLLKLPQTAPVFFVSKKDDKKHMVQNYQYLNK